MDNPIPMPTPRELLIERVGRAMNTHELQRDYVIKTYSGREVKRELDFIRDWYLKDTLRALSEYLGDDMPCVSEA